MANLWKRILENRMTIVLTFEIFWIAVFLLEAAGTANDNGAMQFIYANF
jgi:hypothetical protein